MTSLPSLTEMSIRAITDSRSYERGQAYFRERRIEEPQRQGQKLRAKVLGSQLYYCEVTFHESGIASSYCTCPVSGSCKHVVALLLAWLNHPSYFSELAQPQILLQQRDRDDLIELIIEMIDRHPDLETLLHLPLPRKAPNIERSATIINVNPSAQNVTSSHEQAVFAHSPSITPASLSSADLSGNTVFVGETMPIALVAVNSNSLQTGTRQVATTATSTVDPTMIRRQLRAARAFGSPESNNCGSANFYKVHKVRDWGDKYAAASDWRNAVLVYTTILDELLTNYEEYANHEGELPGYEGCIEGLQYALAFVSESTPRQQILQTLLRAWLWDVKQGGLGVGDDIPETILAGAMPTEKQLVAEWLQKEVIQENEPSAISQWRRPIYGSFLLALHGDGVDDETYLRICRQTGRTAELLDRLLTLQRVEEAIELVSRASDHEIAPLADIYVKHEQAALAVRLLEERVRNKANSNLLAWLKNHFVTESNPDRAFEYARLLFRQSPSVEGYLELHGLVADEGQWQQVRGEQEKWLQGENRWELLARIHLKSGAIDKAIQAIRSGEQGRHQRKDYWYTEHMRTARLAVAAAAEGFDPDFALESYLQTAERAIAARNRGSYVVAAQYLLGVQRVYQRLGALERWQQTIKSIRNQYRSLRVLQDELSSAGL